MQKDQKFILAKNRGQYLRDKAWKIHFRTFLFSRVHDKIIQYILLGVAQLVARAVRDCEVVGSNPITQTTGLVF